MAAPTTIRPPVVTAARALLVWAVAVAAPIVVFWFQMQGHRELARRLADEDLRDAMAQEMIAFRADLAPSLWLERRLQSLEPRLREVWRRNPPRDATRQALAILENGLGCQPLLLAVAGPDLETVSATAHPDFFSSFNRPSEKRWRQILAAYARLHRRPSVRGGRVPEDRGPGTAADAPKWLRTWLSPHLPTAGFPNGSVVTIPAPRHGFSPILTWMRVLPAPSRQVPRNRPARTPIVGRSRPGMPQATASPRTEAPILGMVFLAIRETDLPRARILAEARQRSRHPGLRRAITRPVARQRLGTFEHRGRLLMIDTLEPWLWVSPGPGGRAPFEVGSLARTHLRSALPLLAIVPATPAGSRSQRAPGPTHAAVPAHRADILLEWPAALALLISAGLGYRLWMRGTPWLRHLRLRFLLAVLAATLPPIVLGWSSARDYLAIHGMLERQQRLAQIRESIDLAAGELASDIGLQQARLSQLNWLLLRTLTEDARGFTRRLPALLADLPVSALYLFFANGRELQFEPDRRWRHRANAHHAVATTRAGGLRLLVEDGTVGSATVAAWLRQRNDRLTNSMYGFIQRSEIARILQSRDQPLDLQLPALRQAGFIQLRIPSPVDPIATLGRLFVTFDRQRLLSLAVSGFRRHLGAHRRQSGDHEIRLQCYTRAELERAAVHGDHWLGWPAADGPPTEHPNRRAPQRGRDAGRRDRLLDRAALHAQSAEHEFWYHLMATDRGPVTLAGRAFADPDCVIAAVAEPRFAGWQQRVDRLVAAGFALWSLASVVAVTALLARVFLGPLATIQAALAAIADGTCRLRLELPAGDELSRLATAVDGMAHALVERERLRRFVSSRVDQLARDGTADLLQPGGELVTVTVLFSDLRGFTHLTEVHPADRVVGLLNEYFAAMEPAIEENAGVIDKFIGDAIQAVFFPVTDRDSASRGLAAAQAMRTALVRFNRRRQERGDFTVDSGIGLATGPVVAGRVGSREGRLDETVIGEVVARAARLETLTRQPGVAPILVDAATAHRLPPQIQRRILGARRADSDPPGGRAPQAEDLPAPPTAVFAPPPSAPDDPRLQADPTVWEIAAP